MPVAKLILDARVNHLHHTQQLREAFSEITNRMQITRYAPHNPKNPNGGGRTEMHIQYDDAMSSLINVAFNFAQQQGLPRNGNQFRLYWGS